MLKSAINQSFIRVPRKIYQLMPQNQKMKRLTPTFSWIMVMQKKRYLVDQEAASK